MRKTLAIILLGTLLGTTCKSQPVTEELKGRDVVLFVADEEVISPADVPFPVVFTGM